MKSLGGLSLQEQSSLTGLLIKIVFPALGKSSPYSYYKGKRKQKHDVSSQTCGFRQHLIGEQQISSVSIVVEVPCDIGICVNVDDRMAEIKTTLLLSTKKMGIKNRLDLLQRGNSSSARRLKNHGVLQPSKHTTIPYLRPLKRTAATPHVQLQKTNWVVDLFYSSRTICTLYSQQATTHC